MSTNLAIEQEEQRRWVPRPKYAHLDWFDTLVANEFLSVDEQYARQKKMLSNMAAFAATQVPYYRDLFRNLGLNRRDVREPGDLPRLPALTKRTVQENGAELRPPALPRGQRPGPPTASSGSTGPPTRVAQTLQSFRMFVLGKQRELRWCRFDPAATLAHIRNRPLPPGPDGKPVAEGETGRAETWPLVGPYFETGPFIGLKRTTPLDRIAEWLERERPDYLLTEPSVLEHLAFAFQGRPSPDSLRGLQAIGETMTPGMRERIEKTFGVPVHLNYGLNEFGLIASPCREGGRYHVHAEHYLVEIVDAEGNPCAPGAYGRLLVTTLTNAAMPLIRYDSGDMAQATDGPCPCNRTLPSFGPVLGRYGHIVSQPPDILAAVDALRGAMERLPPELSGDLREYQVHRRRDGDFELRLVVAGVVPSELTEHILEVWHTATGSHPLALSITEVDRIVLSPNRKFFHFTSDFESSPVPEAAPERSGGET